jgi:hypothetical protein
MRENKKSVYKKQVSTRKCIKKEKNEWIQKTIDKKTTMKTKIHWKQARERNQKQSKKKKIQQKREMSKA